MGDDKTYKPYAFKLDKEKDKKYIDFLEGKPITYIIKEALDLYMQAEEVKKNLLLGVGGGGYVAPVAPPPPVQYYPNPVPAPNYQQPQNNNQEEQNEKREKVNEDEIPF